MEHIIDHSEIAMTHGPDTSPMAIPALDRLAAVNHGLHGLGPASANEHISKLTALCGEVLGGTWATYSYLDGDLLHAIARWRTPPDYKAVCQPKGFPCAEVIIRGGDEALIVGNLPETRYAETVPYVIPYHLKTYVGHPVSCHGRTIGTLSVVFQDNYIPREGDPCLLGILASAIGMVEERKEAEQAFQRAFSETEAVLAHLPSGICIVNEDQVVVWATPVASRYLGPGHDTIIGRSLSELLPTEVVQWVRASDGLSPEHQSARPRMLDHEFHLEQRVYRYRCAPTALRGGRRPCTCLVIWDVTQERRLQEQLEHAAKLAGLGTMLTGMAHEINNPSQAILGMAEQISEEAASDTIKGYALDIAGYAKHIAAVVRDFACYARSSSREGNVDVNLPQELTEAVRMVQRGPSFGKVEVVWQLEPIPTLRARRTEIEQLFINLVSNAVQAMKGTGRLTLSTRQEGQRTLVSVADTGCGIPESMLAKIFDPFFTTKDPGCGTGLGLNIATKFAAKYGGRIDVASKIGQGTTFTIEFPIDEPSKGGA